VKTKRLTEFSHRREDQESILTNISSFFLLYAGAGMSRIWQVAIVMSLALSGSMPSFAHADYFGFSFGSGGHGGHHGHHHYHHCPPAWGISYGVFAPPPPRVVYVEPPIVRERVYVQPTVVQERVILPTPTRSNSVDAGYSSNTLPPPPNRESVDKPIVIRNGSNKGVPVAFVVDNQDEELNDGQTRTFSTTGNRTVEFDRGGNRGVARYELSGGVYSFVVTNNGWDLVRDTETTRTAKQPIPRKNSLPNDSTLR
jgi:hypothetical protein